jgi:hypothetical protein
MFEARNSRGSLLEAYRHVYRRRLRLIRVVGVLLTVAGAVLVLVGDFRVGILYVVGGLGLAVVGPFAAAQAGVRASWRVAGVMTRYDLGPDGVRTVNPVADASFDWADVEAADRLPGQWVLRLGGVRFLPLPVADLTDDQRARVEAVVREHTPDETPDTAEGPGSHR